MIEIIIPIIDTHEKIVLQIFFLIHIERIENIPNKIIDNPVLYDNALIVIKDAFVINFIIYLSD